MLEQMMVLVIVSCSYCDPEKPALKARKFSKGETFNASDINPLVLEQMVTARHVEPADEEMRERYKIELEAHDAEQLALEKKVVAPTEKAANPWSKPKPDATAPENDAEQEDETNSDSDENESENADIVDNTDIDDIAKLREQAVGLGIDVDNRWKETRLQKEIDDAVEANQAAE